MEPDKEVIQTPKFSDEQRLASIKKKPQVICLNDIYQQGIGSQCGYCHKEDGSLQWSFQKKKMDPYTYQLLMERGWRRCGTFYYKPNLQKSCCKLFTHRLEVGRFKLKKDQKKALKRVIALAYQKIQQMQNEEKQIPQKHSKNKQQNNKKVNQKPQILQIQQLTKHKLVKVCLQIKKSLKNKLYGLLNNSGLIQDKFDTQYNFEVEDKLKFFISKPGENSDYYSNFIMLLFGINKKLFGNPKYSLIDFSKDVKDFVQNLGLIQNFRIAVQRGGYLLFKKYLGQKSNQFQILEQKQQKVQQLSKVDKVQQEGEKTGLNKIVQTIKNKLKGGVNGSNEQKQSEMLDEKKASKKFEILQPTHKYKGELDITQNKITFGKITIQIVPAEQNVDSFKIYQEYTNKIHQKKQKKLSSYVNFLCLQALQFRKSTSKINHQNKQPYIPSWDPTSKHQKPKPVVGQVQKLLGCYHMKYFIEGNLLAVGVVDMVDDGLSSVYFFYDPKYKECRLGVFSSLIEIEYVRWMRLSFPEFRNYYMGFYISNSQKMNYKVDYMPCQLLCPITYRFVQFTDEIKFKTDKIAKNEEKNIRLAKKQQEIIDDMHFKRDLGPFIDKNLKLIYDGKPVVLKQINPHFFVHILKILNINVPVYGKKVFQLLTFSI